MAWPQHPGAVKLPWIRAGGALGWQPPGLVAVPTAAVDSRSLGAIS